MPPRSPYFPNRIPSYSRNPAFSFAMPPPPILALRTFSLLVLLSLSFLFSLFTVHFPFSVPCSMSRTTNSACTFFHSLPVRAYASLCTDLKGLNVSLLQWFRVHVFSRASLYSFLSFFFSLNRILVLNLMYFVSVVILIRNIIFSISSY